MIKITRIALAAATTVVAAGCAGGTGMNGAELDAKAVAMMKQDFQAKGIATMERINQDEVQQLCTKYGEHPPNEASAKLEKAQQERIKWPADGTYLGDWKKGQKLAQSGKGMTWSDKGGDNGGNCYNCHQLSPTELSFGTIGPSLLNYGKLRGQSMEVQQYTYGKVYNSKAYNLCSNMPRFGHFGILTEAQIKDLVAYLLDPASPVNQ
jgi:sulfur-oxidizing protein SoxX